MKLTAALKRAEKAREEAAQAEADVQTVEADHQARRLEAARQVRQQFVDTYDPDQLRADVVDAEAELRRALAESELGRALTGYMAAIRRESKLARHATTCDNNGAPLDEYRRRRAQAAAKASKDGQGRDLPSMAADQQAAQWLNILTHQVAETIVKDEMDALEEQHRAAVAAVND